MILYLKQQYNSVQHNFNVSADFFIFCMDFLYEYKLLHGVPQRGIHHQLIWQWWKKCTAQILYCIYSASSEPLP